MRLQKEDILSLLKSEGAEMEALLREAGKLREACFQDKIFLYGFVYFSTWCRNNCSFCYYRKANDIDRYRKSAEEILQVAADLAESGVHLIDLTMGEDEVCHQEGFVSVLDMVRRIRSDLGKPVMISPGVIPNPVIDEFARVKTDWYALYQETHNQQLFADLRLNQSYDERMEAKRYAGESGMLVEEGIMTGIGETLDDIADSLMMMGSIGASQMRVMSFIPQKGSPMEACPTPDIDLERKIIAILRIMYPTALIPASLDIEGIAGLKRRMEAGANVVTSIIPPHSGLMGVAQSTKDVDEGGRTVTEVTAILHSLGLQPASQQEYDACVQEKKREMYCLPRRV